MSCGVSRRRGMRSNFLRSGERFRSRPIFIGRLTPATGSATKAFLRGKKGRWRLLRPVCISMQGWWRSWTPWGSVSAFVTLHVGAGTFQPLRTSDLDAHKMHAERVSVSAAAWEAIQRTRASGGRVVAVGTTVVRALESAALHGSRSAMSHVGGVGDSAACDAPALKEPVHADAAGHTSFELPAAGSSASTWWLGETRLFIRPGFEFRVVDAMVTNFHLPESTLLMLVSAFAGRENVLAAYTHAVCERYRFFSYGDAMLVTPAKAMAGSSSPHSNGTATP